MGNTATFPNKELIKASDILPSVEKNLSQLRIYHKELTTNKSLNTRVQNLLDELDILAQINKEADKLSDLDGASLLFKFMKALKGSLKNKSVFKCYETIRGVFWNATDHSKGFCDKCKECGLMEYLLDDLRTYKSIFKNDLENHGYLVFQAISILQNCAKSSQVCLLHLRQLNVANLLYWYRENSSKLPIRSWTCLDLLSAVLLSHAVVEKEQKDDIFVVSDQLLYDVTEKLIQSLQDARHRCEGFSTEELLVDLSLFSNNDKNNYVLARASDFITSLAEVLKSGKDKEILPSRKLYQIIENIKIVKSSEKILGSVRRIQTKSGNQKHKVIATQIISAIDAHSDESNSNKDKDGDIDETIQLGSHFRNLAQVLSSTDFSTSVNSSSSTSSSGQRETDSVKQFVKDQLDTMKDGRNRLQRFSVINEAATQSLAKLNLSLTNPAKNKEYHLAVANEIANLGGVAVCQSFMEMMRNYEENQISDQDNRSTGEFLDNIGNLCWNASNISFRFCDECGRCGLLKHLVEILQQLENTFNQDLNGQGFRVLQAVSILHNCARLGVSDKYFGQLHMSNLIKRYAKKSRNVQIREHTTLRVVCTLLTAYTMDEKTDNVIIAEPSVIQYIIQNLHIAMSTSDHKYDGFSAEELVDGLDKLAQVDQNSLEIVKEEMVLGSLQEMLQEGDEEEKMAAVKLIHRLAFVKENKQKFKSNDEIMNLLHYLAIDSSTNNKLQNNAESCLFVLKMGDMEKVDWASSKKADEALALVPMSKAVKSISPVDRRPESKNTLHRRETQSDGPAETGLRRKHVMISYQWDSQNIMIKVKEQLETSGYQVWMDIESMEANLLDSMAKAVEESAVVLMCISKKYRDSKHCRQEAEYASEWLGPDDIIPLLVEKSFKPNGWLGLLKGTKFHYDLTDGYSKTIHQQLIRRLGNRGKKLH